MISAPLCSPCLRSASSSLPPQHLTCTASPLPPLTQEHSLFAYNEQLTWRKLGRLLLIPTNVLVISQVQAWAATACGSLYRLPWLLAVVFCEPSSVPHQSARLLPSCARPTSHPAGPVWLPALGHDPDLPQRLPVSEQGPAHPDRHPGGFEPGICTASAPPACVQRGGRAPSASTHGMQIVHHALRHLCPQPCCLIQHHLPLPGLPPRSC